jgi:hypothetical protein
MGRRREKKKLFHSGKVATFSSAKLKEKEREKSERERENEREREIFFSTIHASIIYCIEILLHSDNDAKIQPRRYFLLFLSLIFIE